MKILDTSLTKEAFQDARRHRALDKNLFILAVSVLKDSEACKRGDLFIASVQCTSSMYKAKFARVTTLVPPDNLGGSSRSWFADVDIFQQKRVVLPFDFMKPGTPPVREHHIVVIDMQSGTFDILSPRYLQNMHVTLVEVSSASNSIADHSLVLLRVPESQEDDCAREVDPQSHDGGGL